MISKFEEVLRDVLDEESIKVSKISNTEVMATNGYRYQVVAAKVYNVRLGGNKGIFSNSRSFKYLNKKLYLIK